MLEIQDNNDNAGLQPPPGIVSPRSRCPKCKTPLGIVHNIPILGYLVVSGRCAFCNQSISIRYPAIELLTAALSVVLGLTLGTGWILLFAFGFTCTLLVLSLIDIDYQILPDNIVLPLLWAGLIANLPGRFCSLESAVVGALAGYLGLWVIYQVHHRITGKEGMGYGDFKLLAAIGAWLGWEMLPLVVLLASLSGTVIAGFNIVLRNQGRQVPISFGPYLAIAAWIALVWSQSMVQQYLRMFAI